MKTEQELVDLFIEAGRIHHKAGEHGYWEGCLFTVSNGAITPPTDVNKFLNKHNCNTPEMVKRLTEQPLEHSQHLAEYSRWIETMLPEEHEPPTMCFETTASEQPYPAKGLKYLPYNCYNNTIEDPRLRSEAIRMASDRDATYWYSQHGELIYNHYFEDFSWELVHRTLHPDEYDALCPNPFADVEDLMTAPDNNDFWDFFTSSERDMDLPF